ncbi:MAG TPA: preprotein translocase subunit Sec61beta [Candidatus Thermoplasmatota archaeon]|nr:preprotein translocase subunit Sec61beta [Candidatus Thermoplasmatota archaeon]
MAKKDKGEGFHSSAGLIRYFDAEEKSSIKIPPWFVVALSVAVMIIITVAHLTIEL